MNPALSVLWNFSGTSLSSRPVPFPIRIQTNVYDAVLCEEIRKNSFDLVFSVNFIPVIATVCHRLQVPYFCWIVDSPVIQLYSHTLQYDSNYVFLF